jgi:hypothetical protein
LVIVKDDAGTHGMRIMAVREAREAVGPNCKRRDTTPTACTRTRALGRSAAASGQ